MLQNYVNLTKVVALHFTFYGATTFKYLAVCFVKHSALTIYFCSTVLKRVDHFLFPEGLLIIEVWVSELKMRLINTLIFLLFPLTVLQCFIKLKGYCWGPLLETHFQSMAVFIIETRTKLQTNFHFVHFTGYFQWDLRIVSRIYKEGLTERSL